MKVAVTGATGLVGSSLCALLAERGDEVRTIGRRPRAGGFDWSDSGLRDALRGADALVHLAGENLFARRWTPRQKERIVESRVETARRLAGLTAELGVGTSIGASAVGYYGASPRQGLDETTPPAQDFLARLCQEWEAATHTASAAGVRTLTVRLGVILGRDGGALARMLPPFRFGLGGPLGSGQQWVSWIHVADTTRALCFLLDDPHAHGAYNLTAPAPVRMDELAATLGRMLHRPARLPVPAFALRLVLGEGADVLLTGQHVVPKRLLDAGYAFRYPSLDEALRDLLA